MEWLGNIAFGLPWALTALLALPLLWRLLKTVPPQVKTVHFPAVRLLQELSNEQTLATKTPWWILLLRSLIIVCLVIAMSTPVLNGNNAIVTSKKPHIIIIDNDWSVIERWNGQKEILRRLITQSLDANVQTYLLTSGGQYDVIDAEPARLRQALDNLTPTPWAHPRDNLRERLNNLINTINQDVKISWISNAIHTGESTDFFNQLSAVANVDYIAGDQAPPPAVITGIQRRDTGYDIILHRLSPIAINLIVQDDQGSILHRQSVPPQSGESDLSESIILPPELKSRAASIRIDGFSTPATQYLLDEKWRDRPVALITTSNANDTALLAPTYYVKKSLAPYTTLYDGPLDSLLDRQMAVLFDVNYSHFSEQQNDRLLNWIKQGGVFVRFASDIDQADKTAVFDPLLPVQLMPTQRTLGGALSWKQTHRLAPFPENSPFYGLPIAEDIRVERQILARPENNLASKSWAQLSDGTPLITAQQMEAGWSVLFHVEPVPGWSNLPLSGIFEEMMKRLLTLSNVTSLKGEEQELRPYRVFDHNGVLVIPDHQATPLPLAQWTTQPPSRNHPPGLYGVQDNLKAYNLGPFVADTKIITDIPADINILKLEQDVQINLAPWFMFCALLFGLVDWIIRLATPRRIGAFASAVFLTFFLIGKAQADTDWDKALAAANDMRLAYMITQNERTNETLVQGLNGLGAVLKRRTAVELAAPMAFNPETDDPALFPMIYWVVGDSVPDFSEQAYDKLSRFLKTGGFILFDTMGQENAAALHEIGKKLDIASLQPVPSDHVLTRSFYLMQRFPGRFDYEDVWVEANADSRNDRVSSVLIGRNAWAQAWARDENLRPLYPVVPGGESQREQAMRFGVNLVMYILSGNYKGDQVHIPAILQRLGL